MNLWSTRPLARGWRWREPFPGSHLVRRFVGHYCRVAVLAFSPRPLWGRLASGGLAVWVLPGGGWRFRPPAQLFQLWWLGWHRPVQGAAKRAMPMLAFFLGPARRLHGVGAWAILELVMQPFMHCGTALIVVDAGLLGRG